MIRFHKFSPLNNKNLKSDEDCSCPSVETGGAGAPSGTYTSVGAGNYTVLTTDGIIGKTSITSGGDTVTLPSSAEVGQTFTIKDVNGTSATDPITIDTAGGELIDGVATYVISSNYQSITVIFDGSNYSII